MRRPATPPPAPVTCSSATSPPTCSTAWSRPVFSTGTHKEIGFKWAPSRLTATYDTEGKVSGTEQHFSTLHYIYLGFIELHSNNLLVDFFLKVLEGRSEPVLLCL